MRLLLLTIFSFAFGTSQAQCRDLDGTTWNSIDMNVEYKVSSSGAVLADSGATVLVSSTTAAPGASGGAIAAIEAKNFEGARVTLSADLEAGAGTSGAAIWLRLDGGPRKGFTSSGAQAVNEGTEAHRSIALNVPQGTKLIVFGVTLSGRGSVRATTMKITQQKINERDTAEARQVVKQAMSIIELNALNSTAVNWKMANADVRAELGEHPDSQVAHGQIRRILALLKDDHSVLVGADEAKRLDATGTATGPFGASLLPDGIGYVQVPGFKGSDSNAQAAFVASVNADIRATSTNVVRGWIVDLRTNTGGNMWPMLAAMYPFLGDGLVGGTRQANGRVTPFYSRDSIATVPVEARLNLQASPVAVLIGSETSSSGEALAIAFHGRPSTRFFGRSTAGRTTVNSSYDLVDGSRIYLTTAVDLDRNGMVFENGINPDFFVVSSDGEPDSDLSAAISWLNGMAR